jgi:hypothetical protein
MGFLFHVKDLFLASLESAWNLVKRFGSWVKEKALNALHMFTEFVDDLWEKAEKAFQAAKVSLHFFSLSPTPPSLDFFLFPSLSSYDFLGVCAREGGTNMCACKRDRR